MINCKLLILTCNEVGSGRFHPGFEQDEADYPFFIFSIKQKSLVVCNPVKHSCYAVPYVLHVARKTRMKEFK